MLLERRSWLICLFQEAGLGKNGGASYPNVAWFFTFSIPRHTMWDWHICLHEWLIFMVNVRKYTSPMDGMGLVVFVYKFTPSPKFKSSPLRSYRAPIGIIVFQTPFSGSMLNFRVYCLICITVIFLNLWGVPNDWCFLVIFSIFLV